jgi:Oxidoreductase FAD-binding domain
MGSGLHHFLQKSLSSHLKLSTSSHTAVRHPVFPITFPPGPHLSLKLGNVVRKFTPVYSGSNPDEVEIVIRLVPGGPFSDVLSSSIGLTPQGPFKSDWSECCLECGAYGPLLALPSKFGYCPYYSSGNSPEVNPLRPTLIMIGAGSGTMPFFVVLERL